MGLRRTMMAGGSGADPTATANSLLGKLLAWFDFDGANPHRDGWGVYDLNGTITTVAGKLGNAAPSGITRLSTVHLPSAGSSTMSVGAWLKMANTTARQSFGIGQNTASGDRVSVGTSSTGNQQAASFSSTGTSYSTQGSAVSVGTYRHMHADVTPSGPLNLYVNGAAQGTPATVGATLRSTNVVAVGDVAGSVSTADVDAAYVALGALTADELALIYNGGTGRTLADIIALSTVSVPACHMEGLTVDRAKYAFAYLKKRIGRISGTGHTLVRGNVGHGGSEKRWFAVKYDRVGNLGSDIIGLVNTSAATSYPGADANGLGVQFSRAAGVGRYHSGSFTSSPVFTPVSADGDIVMIAWNASSRKVWIGKNGTWSGDPAAGTGELFTFGSAQTLYAAMSDDAASAKNLSFLMDPAELPYSSPSGFSGWGA